MPVQVDGDERLGDATAAPMSTSRTAGLPRWASGPTKAVASFGYAIDFHDFTPEMKEHYEGVDLWICDCLRRTPHPTHAHLDAVLGWARELKVGQLLLTHLDKTWIMRR